MCFNKFKRFNLVFITTFLSIALLFNFIEQNKQSKNLKQASSTEIDKIELQRLKVALGLASQWNIKLNLIDSAANYELACEKLNHTLDYFSRPEVKAYFIYLDPVVLQQIKILETKNFLFQNIKNKGTKEQKEAAWLELKNIVDSFENRKTKW